MMENKVLMEKRSLNRKRLTGLLPGGLFNSNNERVSCKPIDISEQGLGILSGDMLKTGDNLTLQVRDNPIGLVVAWVKPDFGKQDLFRYGLVVTDPEIDLARVFEQKKCLK